PNNISDKTRSLCCSTAEPHQAYDCSALALGALKLIYTNKKKSKRVLLSEKIRNSTRFILER
ncbi:hypothetical protein, partial [Lacticaseibacillus rhamnosus]|uniref:hypothetical protein n=1 Tax=Lacticaseibacillus rhamnosus TaxID=47715 RepID=UPI0019D384C3